MKIIPSPGIMIHHITFLNKDCILCIYPAHQGFKRIKLWYQHSVHKDTWRN